MNKIYLYVDQLNNDSTVGLTEDPDTIAYNISQMGLKEQFGADIIDRNEAGRIGHIGKYLYSFMVSLESKDYNMLFLDLENNEGKAFEASSDYGSKSHQKEFMNAFYDISSKYPHIDPEVILVQGKPPKI